MSRRFGFLALAAAGLIGAGVGALLAWPSPERPPGMPQPGLRGLVGFDPAGLLRGLEGVSAPPRMDGAAAPLVLHASNADRTLATRCLADAIYYEAAQEPLAGRRAVAQVVLNRLRDPHFPKTVCGVVYQGCQFSFTCDGARRRAPMAGAYQGALAVAREALAGRVEPSAGLATHYHALSVAPAWRSAMVKVARIGSQMFYRWPGTAGRAGAFTGRYAGGERVPQAPAGDDLGAEGPALAAVVEDAAPAASIRSGRPLRSKDEIAAMNRRLEAVNPLQN